jgi:clan AA aspartic protease
MGHSWVEIEVSNLERTRLKKVNALVDMGASLTVLPKKLAEELEIKPLSTDEVSTGGGMIKVERGRALIRLKNKEDVFPVWISSVIDKVLLGVVVLEVFGFEVDPATGKLKERPLLLY